MRWTSTSFHFTHQMHPEPWAEAIPWLDFHLPVAGITQTVFSSMLFMGTLSPSVCNSFDRAGPAWLADCLVLTNQEAFVKCGTSRCWNVPAPIALSEVFNSPLYHLIFLEAGAWEGMWYTQSMPCSLAQVSVRSFQKWILLSNLFLSGVPCHH